MDQLQKQLRIVLQANMYVCVVVFFFQILLLFEYRMKIGKKGLKQN